MKVASWHRYANVVLYVESKLGERGKWWSCVDDVWNALVLLRLEANPKGVADYLVCLVVKLCTGRCSRFGKDQVAIDSVV